MTGITSKLACSVLSGVAMLCAAMATQPSHALSQTITDRVKALEGKTRYYNQRQKKIIKSYVKTATAPSSRLGCTPTIDFSFNPGITLFGSIYVWMTADIKYAGDPGGQMEFDMGRNGGGSCGTVIVPASPSAAGVVTIKKFCSFDAEPGLRLWASLGPNSSTSCSSIITEANVTMKSTVIELQEPP